MNHVLAGAIIGAVLAMNVAPTRGAGLLPDPALTPGAVLDTSVETICRPGYAREHRVWRGKRSTLEKYGVPPNQSALYKDDDLIPLCLGGNNSDPRNHWAQLRGGPFGAEIMGQTNRPMP